jgi:hypothetical protein
MMSLVEVEIEMWKGGHVDARFELEMNWGEEWSQNSLSSPPRKSAPLLRVIDIVEATSKN